MLILRLLDGQKNITDLI
jgi:cell division control protein 7